MATPQKNTTITAKVTPAPDAEAAKALTENTAAEQAAGAEASKAAAKNDEVFVSERRLIIAPEPEAKAPPRVKASAKTLAEHAAGAEALANYS